MIAWHRTDAIARITIDRGGARNAITLKGWDALMQAARDIAASDAHVVVLAAGGAAFSAGADLSEMATLADDAGARTRFRLAMRGAIDALAALPMPLVAAVDGGCYGAAVALVLAADLIVVGDGASFAITPAKLGIGYPGEDVARLVARIGAGQASRMLLTAQAIDADEAWRIGLAQYRAADAAVAAASLTEGIAALAPSALRLLKRTIADPLAPGAAGAFEAAFGGPAFAKRLAAFRARQR